MTIDIPSRSEPVEKKPRGSKPKHTFMLHDTNMVQLGKYSSSDYRYAALKAASRGYKKIKLRKTNTKLIYEYDGDIVTLDTPQVVMRGEREIKYSKKPVVKFIKKYVYDGEIDDDANVPDQPRAPKE